MEGFTIKGNGDFLTITFTEVFGFPDTTFHWGGYDVRVTLEIKSGDFAVKSAMYTSTGEIFNFYNELKKCNESLFGTAKFISYEGNLEFLASYDTMGHVTIEGTFSKQNEFDNRLKFEFVTDQTFIRYSVEELGLIADKYGDMKGVKK